MIRTGITFTRFWPQITFRSYTMYRHIDVTVSNGVQIITLNRPEKRNAISAEMYNEIPKALLAGAEDDNVVVTVMTGAGNFYSSGNDMSSYLSWTGDMAEAIDLAALRLEKYVRAFISYPKTLVAIINGPAIGLAATTLALFDLSYISEKATIQTPFTQLGLTPEGCSSYTFPKIMGTNRAAQLLCFNRKIDAREALEWGLVSEIYVPGEEKMLWGKINQLAQLPSKSLIYAKRLLKSQEQTALYAANQRECEQLRERWSSEECMNAVIKFFDQKKSKL